ncbi:hypothetical protein L208DRAFT_1374423 [Tricholoma matsutake]|nr:hypothetical protein L208DRAFT_1374423 [Tricholoma matsutake 945]
MPKITKKATRREATMSSHRKMVNNELGLVPSELVKSMPIQIKVPKGSVLKLLGGPQAMQSNLMIKPKSVNLVRIWTTLPNLQAMISQLTKPGHQHLFFVGDLIAFIKNAKIQLQKAAVKDSSLPHVLMNYTESKAALPTLAPEDWHGEARIDTGWENIEHLTLPEVEQ